MNWELLELVRQGALMFLLLLASVTIHEWAHAFVANRLGDPLPRAQGRLTLNPLAHIDTMGTLILPGILVLMPLIFGGQVFSLFGWGKPVPLSLGDPKTRRSQEIKIMLAGPAANLSIALIAACLGGLLSPWVPKIEEFFALVILLNSSLFLFNLLPIPPLDGARLMRHLFKMKEETYMQWSRYGFFVVLILLNFTPLRFVVNFIVQSLNVGFFSVMQLMSL